MGEEAASQLLREAKRIQRSRQRACLVAEIISTEENYVSQVSTHFFLPFLPAYPISTLFSNQLNLLDNEYLKPCQVDAAFEVKERGRVWRKGEELAFWHHSPLTAQGILSPKLCDLIFSNVTSIRDINSVFLSTIKTGRIGEEHGRGHSVRHVEAIP